MNEREAGSRGSQQGLSQPRDRAFGVRRQRIYKESSSSVHRAGGYIIIQRNASKERKISHRVHGEKEYSP